MTDATHGTPGWESWFPTRRPNLLARARLFCFHFAGGSSAAYNGWASSLPAEVEVCAVQLPGRERRLREAPYREMGPLVEALGAAMAPLLDRPFAFFGYSLGGRVAHALVQRLRERGAPLPHLLVAAATEAPHVRVPKPVSGLSDEEFITRLREYEGTPAAVLEHRELMELLLPMLRADFTLAQGLQPLGPPLPFPVLAWGGAEDPHVSHEALARWRETAGGEFHLRLFPGKHFFLKTAREEVLAALRQALERWLPPGGR